MNRRRGHSAAAILLCALTFLTSAALNAEEITIIPPEYYTGDAVTLRIVLSGPESERLPYLVKEDKWFQLKNIDTAVREDKIFLFLQVIPFYPGAREFPPIRYGGRTITGIVFRPKKVLDEGDYPFAPLRETMLLPGSKLYLLLSLLAAAAAAAVIVAAVKQFRGISRRIAACFSVWKGDMLRKRTLRYLLQNCTALPPREIYRQLTAEIKKTIERECKLPCAHLTSTEIAESFSAGYAAVGEKISAVLRRADAVRFGNIPVSAAEIEEDLHVLESAAYELNNQDGPLGQEKRQCL